MKATKRKPRLPVYKTPPETPAPAAPAAPEWSPPRNLNTKSNRKVFLFTDAEIATLEDFARAYSVSEGSVVRTALKFYFAAAPDEQPEPDRTASIDEEGLTDV